MKLFLLDPVVADTPIDDSIKTTFLIISFIALLILLLIFYLVKKKK